MGTSSQRKDRAVAFWCIDDSCSCRAKTVRTYFNHPQADPTGRAPTGAAPKDAVYSPLRSLLAFAVAALRDAAAPDGAQVAELAVLLAVAVLVQVTPHEPSEARRREAYMWVLCLTEGHDEYCIPFLMGLVGRAMNSVRDQIFEAPEELPRDLLLTYAADLLRAIESDGAHPNYGALQVCTLLPRRPEVEYFVLHAPPLSHHQNFRMDQK